ncbi:MAG: HD domain-containing protein [Chitinophagaceae bacterium]
MRKIINDPVHGFITVDNPLIYQIISHPYFQRLRRIKQMALAYLVYPGAVHTRLHHSLGAYHLLSLALQELIQKGVDITPEEKEATQLAILLHDIGHGPFSHALELSLLNTHHEELSLQIMQLLNNEFKGALDMTLLIFQKKYKKKFLCELVSSQLDMDRLDYLARDSFFTGVSEGVVGYARIIKMLNVVNNQLVVEEKGIHSIEKFLIARRLMYWQVYLHKTVISSENMLTQILKRAKAIASSKNLFATPALQIFLQSQSISQQDYLETFLKLDDTDIISSIKVWQNHEDFILSNLCKRLVERRLFKTQFIHESEVEKVYEIKKKEILKNAIISESEIDYFLTRASTSNETYNEMNQKILIFTKGQEVKDISTIENSLLVDTVLNPTKKYYICSIEGFS